MALTSRPFPLHLQSRRQQRGYTWSVASLKATSTVSHQDPKDGEQRGEKRSPPNPLTPPTPLLIAATPPKRRKKNDKNKLIIHVQALRKSYLAALQRWPKDPLRPECQLQDVLSRRLLASSRFPGKDQDGDAPARQVNALLSLLADRYAGRYAVDPADSRSGGLMAPRSNPTYYGDLMRDLEQAPTRTPLQRFGLKLKGMFRWQ